MVGRSINLTETNMNERNVTHRLIPVSKWNEYHPWPTVSALRDYVFKAERIGLTPAIRRVGRRVLINEEAFFAWVDQQGGCNG